MNTASTVFQGVPLLFKSPITEFTAFIKFPVALTTTCVKKRKTKKSQLVADIYRFDFFASKKMEPIIGRRLRRHKTKTPA
jgi:hypothetical protein